MSTTAATDCAVSLRAVGKRYANGVVALDRLDLDVRPGELVSLLGPSGCGKSTALRIIAGLSEPTGGTVIWPRCDVPRPEREIGFVFQEPTLMPWTTVAGNVRLPLDLQRVETATAAPGWANGFRRRLSARAVRRDEDAGLNRARARHRVHAPAHG